MSEDEECPHGLIPETCSLCKHPFKPPEREWVVYSMIAKYPGTCPKCHSLIIEGDIIAHLLPSDRWVCEGCAR